MNVKNIRSKKALKFVGLLISAMLIATVSAAIYDYMYLDADIGVYEMTLEWTPGADNSTAGTQISGVTATLTNLQGPPNGTRIYADPVRLNNTGGASIDFDLLVDTVSGDTDQMNSTIVRIWSLNTSSWIQNVTIWSNGAKGADESLQIPAYNLWRFQWEITWKATATTVNSVTANLKIQVPV